MINMHNSAAFLSLTCCILLIAQINGYSATARHLYSNRIITSNEILTYSRVTDSGKYQPYIHNIRPSKVSKLNSILNINSIINDKLYVWFCLSLASTLGTKLESTQVGSMISGPLLTMAITLILCNVGIMPYNSMAYKIVTSYLVPLAIPLLLLDADLKKVIKGSGRLMKAFLVGSFGTVVGTFVAYLLVPLKTVVDSEKIIAALCSRHIGGAVNFVAISDILHISPELVAAALAADNVIIALYFLFLFSISVPSKDKSISITATAVVAVAPSTSAVPVAVVTQVATVEKDSSCPMKSFMDTGNSSNDQSTAASTELPLSSSVATATAVNATTTTVTMVSKEASVVQINSSINQYTISVALCISFALVAIGELLHKAYNINSILSVSTIAVMVATLFPKQVEPVIESGNLLGSIMMSYFFATIGAQGHIPSVLRIAPALLLHSFIQIFVHYIVSIKVGKLFKIPFKEMIIASNANVGGPTTASGFASSKRWKSLITPALLTGIFGYAVATSVGLVVYRLLPVMRKFI